MTTADELVAGGTAAGPHYTKDGRRYWLRLPGEAKPRARTRATTFIKALDDAEGLIAWKATMAVVGMLRRPGLHASWAALMAEHPNPWYDGDGPKGEAKKLVESCAEAGGSSDRADVGTALHRMLHVINRGDQANIIDAWRRDIEAYQQALADAGVEVDPAWCEVTVHVPEYDVIGTFDNLARMVGRERHVVMDTKTGDRIKALSFTSQLALYAMGSTAIRWPDDRDAECATRDLPSIDDDIALVAHVPAGKGRCDLWSVDLATGRHALEVARQVRHLRSIDKPDALLKPVASKVAATPAPAAVSDLTDPFDGMDGKAPAGPAPAAVRSWVVERIRELITSHPAAAQALALRWPTWIPKLSERDDHTEAQLDILVRLLVAVEAEHGVAFGAADPRLATAPVPTPTASATVWRAPPEGDEIDQATYDAIVATLTSSSVMARLDAWGAQAHKAMRGFSLRMVRKTRRFEILRAAQACAEVLEDEDIIRVALGLALGEELQPAMTTGMAFGSLSIEQARLLTAVTEAFAGGHVPLSFAEDGTPLLDIAAIAMAA
jgi:hypothetical protein